MEWTDGTPDVAGLATPDRDAPVIAPTVATTDAPLAEALDRLIRLGEISVHFQPIVDLQQGMLLGFEALSRGPSDSPLHSPLVLFDVAARLGRLVELERRVVRVILQRFVELGLPGLLFVNVTADTLIAARDRGAVIHADFARLQLPASRIVVELTETRPVLDHNSLRASIEAMRALGFTMALDDLGEGFASLKRWVEMRPHYVKLDRHFVDGIASDPLKQQLVRSVLEMAKASGAKVIGEGLEQEADLAVLRRIGVALCQGYLIARPSPAPRVSLRPEFEQLLRASSGQRSPGGPRDELTSAGALARGGRTVTLSTSCAQVLDLFARDASLLAIPVLDEEERPIGILRSLTVLKRGAERFFRDLFGRRSCRELMDPNPLVFDAATTLRTMSEAVANLDDRHMVDGFIVTQDGRYFGTGRMSDLLKAVSDLQISSARYANPLTLLPGNVPIDAHIDSLLRQAVDFVVVYWDIDHFKPYNDVYGYRAGDEVIQACARLIVEAADPVRDFVGHVGGDDFVSVHCARDWEARVQRVLDAFAARIAPLFRDEHRIDGGYRTLNRQGLECFHPLMTLSAGVLPVRAEQFETPAQIAAVMAELKSQAKRMPGSSCFVDRRGGPRGGVASRH
jgi:EAL domain-containing protein (putative c-di-GMP-specific phosphodiesterase class I)/GGDEF domain-containing protein